MEKLKTIDELSSVPKYIQLINILKEKIDSGEWKLQDSLPPERELTSFYGISRATVRESLKHMAQEGYIYRIHGQGNYVAHPKIRQSQTVLHSFTDDLNAKGLLVGQKILEMERLPPSDLVRAHLELSESVETVLKIKRLRYANDQPIGLQTAYLPLTVDQDLSIKELEEIGSLYSLLVSKFNIVPVDAYETVEAFAANENEAELLAVEIGSPLLLCERTTFSAQFKPIEYVKMMYPAGSYKYVMRITRSNFR
jgi:GntR family transcriptional regulator